MHELATRLARLGAALRQEGIATSLADAIDAADAVGQLDAGDREELRLGLRIAQSEERGGACVLKGN